MELTSLGKTGLRVSRMGLGGGGHSRLGLSYGNTEAQAEAVVREAIALGVNFIDTAESYRTEEVVGRGIKGTPRDQIVISTKAGIHQNDRLSTAPEMQERVEGCLRRLDTDYVDVFHLHAVHPDDYTYARDEIVPVLEKLRDEGKIRHIGVTEQFYRDTGHRMLQLALQDDCWDVVMVGFMIVNQSGRERVLVRTQEKGIGTLCMFAVRKALSNPETLKETIKRLIEQGEVDEADFDLDNPLGFLLKDGVAGSIEEAAYRFCRHEPGMDVVLSGTGNVEHLRENAKSINGPPLPAEITDRLKAMFARTDSASGN